MKSAFATCPSDCEIIVVDDRSDTAAKALADKEGDPQLKVITNTGDKGAAGARNSGVAIAKGEVVLFVDDDDELTEDYGARVIRAAASGADFGFSAIEVVENGNVRTLRRQQLKRGIISDEIPLEHKTAGLGAGFWIRRETFIALDGIATEQVNDEDTDLCCRLYGAGYRAWFEEEAGCKIHRGYDSGEEVAPQLTLSTDPAVVVACYARTFHRNQTAFLDRPADRWFLLRRALRVAARSGTDNIARELLTGLRPRSWQVKGWMFWKIKKLGELLR